jgi:hypothetical protein
MRRHNIVSRIILILTVITFALAAPALVQEKRQAFIDAAHAPEEVITVSRKRMEEQDMWLEYAMRYYDNVLGHLNPAGIHPDVPPPDLAGVHVPPQNPADSDRESMDLNDYSAPASPADSDRESMDLDDDAMPATSLESGHSHSSSTNPEGSTESEDWHTAPSSPGSSTEEDEDEDYWSTISDVPSAESPSENLEAADSEGRGKAKVSRRISVTASGVDTVNLNVAQMELRNAVDPGP